MIIDMPALLKDLRVLNECAPRAGVEPRPLFVSKGIYEKCKSVGLIFFCGRTIIQERTAEEQENAEA